MTDVTVWRRRGERSAASSMAGLAVGGGALPSMCSPVGAYHPEVPGRDPPGEATDAVAWPSRPPELSPTSPHLGHYTSVQGWMDTLVQV